MRDASGYRGRYSERLLAADEIAIHRVKRNRGGGILDFP